MIDGHNRERENGVGMSIRFREVLVYAVLPIMLLGLGFFAISMIFQGNYLVSGILGLYMLFFGALAIGFFNLERRLRSRLDVELGKEPIFSKICSGQLGLLYYRILLRVTIYEDMLVVRAYDSAVLFPDDIEHIEATRYFLYPILRIQHHSKTAPESIFISTFNAASLKCLGFVQK